MLISGTFHPYAGSPPTPLQPLQVDLSATAISARLEPDEHTDLEWVCQSTHDPRVHASYRRVVTMSNLQTCPLLFGMRTEGPFELLAVTPSAPQVGAGGTGSWALSTSNGLFAILKGFLNFLLPILSGHYRTSVLAGPRTAATNGLPRALLFSPSLPHSISGPPVCASNCRTPSPTKASSVRHPPLGTRPTCRLTNRWTFRFDSNRPWRRRRRQRQRRLRLPRGACCSRTRRSRAATAPRCLRATLQPRCGVWGASVTEGHRVGADDKSNLGPIK